MQEKSGFSERGSEFQAENNEGLPTPQELRGLLRDPNTRRFWGRFQRLVLTAGLSFAMAACGLSRQEIEKTPETTVEELAKNGLDAYRDRVLINTQGIPELVRTEDAEHLELDSIGFGDNAVPCFKTVIKRTDFFKLHAGPGKDSPAIDMAADGGESEYIFARELPKGSGLKGTRLYQILGTVTDMTDLKGNKGAYLKIDSVVDKTVEEYPDINEKK